MQFDKIKKQCNQLFQQLDRIVPNADSAFPNFQKPELDNLLQMVIGYTRKLYEIAKDFEDEISYLNHIKQQNRVLQLQVQNLSQANQELIDIKNLYAEAQQKFRTSMDQLSISQTKIMDYSLQLKNEKQSVSVYQNKIDELNNHVAQLKYQIHKLNIEIDNLDTQLIQQKTQNRQAVKSLKTLEQEKQSLCFEIEKIKLENQQLKAKAEFSIFTKVEYSVKNHSIKDENEAIIESFFQDDHDLMKNVQQNYAPSKKNDSIQEQNKLITRPREKSQFSVKDSVKSTSRKPILRRMTIQVEQPKIPPISQTSIKQKVNFNSSNKLEVKKNSNKNKKQIELGQRRSSGNSPMSIKPGQFGLLTKNNNPKSIKLPNVLKEEVVSIANSDQFCKDPTTKELKNKVNKYQKQISQLQKIILKKSDQICQLEGQGEMKNQKIKALQAQIYNFTIKLQKYQNQQYQLNFAVSKFKKQVAEQKLNFTSKKAQYEKELYELGEACQFYRSQLKNASENQDNLKSLCFKLNSELKELKQNNIKLFPQIQNCFERICEEEREEVQIYSSPERRISSKQRSPKRSSQSPRGAQTERVKIEKKRDINREGCEQNQTPEVINIEKQFMNQSSNYLKRSPSDKEELPGFQQKQDDFIIKSSESNESQNKVNVDNEDEPSELSLEIKKKNQHNYEEIKKLNVNSGIEYAWQQIDIQIDKKLKINSQVYSYRNVLSQKNIEEEIKEQKEQEQKFKKNQTVSVQTTNTQSQTEKPAETLFGECQTEKPAETLFGECQTEPAQTTIAQSQTEKPAETLFGECQTEKPAETLFGECQTEKPAETLFGECQTEKPAETLFGECQTEPAQTTIAQSQTEKPAETLFGECQTEKPAETLFGECQTEKPAETLFGECQTEPAQTTIAQSQTEKPAETLFGECQTEKPAETLFGECQTEPAQTTIAQSQTEKPAETLFGECQTEKPAETLFGECQTEKPAETLFGECQTEPAQTTIAQSQTEKPAETLFGECQTEKPAETLFGECQTEKPAETLFGECQTEPAQTTIAQSQTEKPAETLFGECQTEKPAETLFGECQTEKPAETLFGECQTEPAQTTIAQSQTEKPAETLFGECQTEKPAETLFGECQTEKPAETLFGECQTEPAQTTIAQSQTEKPAETLFGECQTEKPAETLFGECQTEPAQTTIAQSQTEKPAETLFGECQTEKPAETLFGECQTEPAQTTIAQSQTEKPAETLFGECQTEKPAETLFGECQTEPAQTTIAQSQTEKPAETLFGECQTEKPAETLFGECQTDKISLTYNTSSQTFLPSSFISVPLPTYSLPPKSQFYNLHPLRQNLLILQLTILPTKSQIVQRHSYKIPSSISSSRYQQFNSNSGTVRQNNTLQSNQEPCFSCQNQIMPISKSQVLENSSFIQQQAHQNLFNSGVTSYKSLEFHDESNFLPKALKLCQKVYDFNVSQNYTLQNKILKMKCYQSLELFYKPPVSLLLQAYTQTIPKKLKIEQELKIQINENVKKSELIESISHSQKQNQQFCLSWLEQEIKQNYFPSQYSNIQSYQGISKNGQCQTELKLNRQCQTDQVLIKQKSTFASFELTEHEAQTNTDILRLTSSYVQTDNIMNETEQKQCKNILKMQTPAQTCSPAKSVQQSHSINLTWDNFRQINIDKSQQESQKNERYSDCDQQDSVIKSEAKDEILQVQYEIQEKCQKLQKKSFNTVTSSLETCHNEVASSPTREKPYTTQNIINTANISPQISKVQQNQINMMAENEKNSCNVEQQSQGPIKKEEGERENQVLKNDGDVSSETIKLIELRRDKPTKLLKQGQSMDYLEFKTSQHWNMKKLYMLDVQKICGNDVVKNKLILWRKGLIEMPTRLYLVPKIFGKTVKADQDLILGNSEIVVLNGEIRTAKAHISYYTGNLGVQSWKIKRVQVYNFV